MNRSETWSLCCYLHLCPPDCRLNIPQRHRKRTVIYNVSLMHPSWSAHVMTYMYYDNDYHPPPTPHYHFSLVPVATLRMSLLRMFYAPYIPSFTHTGTSCMSLSVPCGCSTSKTCCKWSMSATLPLWAPNWLEQISTDACLLVRSLEGCEWRHCLKQVSPLQSTIVHVRLCC